MGWGGSQYRGVFINKGAWKPSANYVIIPLQIINSNTNDIAVDDTNTDKKTNTDQNKPTDEVKNMDDIIIRNDSAVTRQWIVAALNADTIGKLTNN